MIISVDLMGHGQTDSPKSAERYNMKQAADDLISILDQLSIDKSYVLGYSMGGRLALATAVYYPERMNALLLESSSPGLRTQKERRQRVEKDEALAEGIEKNGMVSFINHWEKLPLFKTQSKQARERLRGQRLRNNPTGLANSLRGMGTGAQDSFWAELSTLHVPVLLVVGDLDQKFCGIAREMDRSLPNSHIITVPEAGHAVHVEHPRFFDKIVQEWIIKKGRTE